MRNLLRETEYKMAFKGKTGKDVLYVTDKINWITWDEFADFAATCNYEVDVTPFVNPDIMVVGDGWWLERRYSEYEEYWRYEKQPGKAGEHNVKDFEFTWAMKGMNENYV